MELSPSAQWRVRRPSPGPERPRTEGLLEAGADAIPVRVVIWQDGYVIGWDDGALGFEDDALWFSGRATSFRLVARDVLAPEPEEGLFVLSDLHLTVGLRHPSRKIKLVFRVLPMKERREWEDETLLETQFERLIRRTDFAGESQYPPLRLRPRFQPMDALSWQKAEARGAFWGCLFSGGPDLAEFFPYRARERLLEALDEEKR